MTMGADVVDASEVFPVRIDRCVYCDATDDLSDEHVLPYGLGGEWKLIAASCGRCRDTTSHLELVIQREHFLAVRTAASLPTRRKHERPTMLAQKLGTPNGAVELLLPIDQHPAALVLPVFPPPLGESARAAGAPMTYRSLRVAKRDGRLADIVRATGAQEWTFPCADPPLFARFLAKVAYCFAVGSYGIDKITEHFVRPHVLAELPGLSAWVGCSDEAVSFTPNGGHHLATIVEDDVIRVEIRLFAVPGTPTYTVLVGRHSDASSAHEV